MIKFKDYNGDSLQDALDKIDVPDDDIINIESEIVYSPDFSDVPPTWWITVYYKYNVFSEAN